MFSFSIQPLTKYYKSYITVIEHNKNCEILYFQGLKQTSLSTLIRVELNQPSSLIDDDQIYNVIVITNSLAI